jgi:hypothetical protein
MNIATFTNISKEWPLKPKILALMILKTLNANFVTLVSVRNINAKTAGKVP